MPVQNCSFKIYTNRDVASMGSDGMERSTLMAPRRELSASGRQVRFLLIRQVQPQALEAEPGRILRDRYNNGVVAVSFLEEIQEYYF